MNYEVKLIASDGSAYTFQLSPRFDLGHTQQVDKVGVREVDNPNLSLVGYIEPSEGAIDPADDCTSKYIELWNFTRKEPPFTVEIRLNSVLKLKLNPADFVSGPFIAGLDPVGQPGQGTEFWEFQLHIEAVRASNKLDSSGLIQDIYRYTRTNYFNNRIFEKIYGAQASGVNAKEKLLSYEPPRFKDLALAKSIFREIDANKWQVEYIFEPWQTEGIRTWLETISITPFAPVLTEIPITGPDAKPLIWKGRNRSAEVSVSGFVESNSKKLEEPGVPLREEASKGIYLDRRRSRFGQPASLIQKTGLYRIDYVYTYLITDSKFARSQIRRPPPIDDGFDAKDEDAPGLLENAPG